MKKILLAMVCGMLAAACCRNDKTAAEYLSEYSESVLGSKAAAVRFNTVSERDSGTETLEIYAEPNPADTIIGIRFQATSEDSRVIYNGKDSSSSACETATATCRRTITRPTPSSNPSSPSRDTPERRSLSRGSSRRSRPTPRGTDRPAGRHRDRRHKCRQISVDIAE